MNRSIVAVLWALGIFAAIHLTDKYTHIEENIMAIAKSTLSFITKEEGVDTGHTRTAKGYGQSGWATSSNPTSHT